MWGRIYPHVIFLIFLNIFKASCEGTSSLTFVIDDTSSMTDDIDQVKTSVNHIMNVVFNEKSSLIKNMVLVTFNDPDATMRVETENRSTFKRALDAVYAHNINNPDCWEPSMNGLLLALDKSLPGSFLYVFTDAPARDYAMSSQVKEMCQRKQTQIVFVLTGRCSGWYGETSFNVYFDIAAACSGLAFYVKKADVNQVLRTIEETIKGNKTVITTRRVPPRVKTDIPFIIDEHTDYAIVSASGSNVLLEIRGPPSHFEWIMWNKNGKVIKISDAIPGQYVATVMGHTATSVVIVGRTDFLFNHGFSKLEPKSLGDTTLQPIADENVHLSILVTDKEHSVEIVSAQILQMDEKPIQELPLREISKDFYITKTFVAPSQRFKLAVKGIVKRTGKPITRIAKISITPQKPPEKLPDRKKPVAQIVEGKTTEVEYDSTVKLTCKVTAYPRPKITWINSKGETVHSSNSVLQYPYEYISYMNIANMAKDDKYVCYAVNEVGRDSKTIAVTVKDPLIVKSSPAGSNKVVYGSEGTITCDIKSSLPMHIIWYYADEITGTNGEIKSSDRYWISPDGTQLKIKKMDFDLVGKYTCRASLVHNNNVQKTFSTRVKIDGLITPKVTGATEMKATKGKTAVLECMVIKGVPKPKMTWQFMDNSGSKYLPIAGSDNVLHISSVENKHAGRYKCVAQNNVGSDEHITTLIVQDLPKITSDPSTVYQSTEGDAFLRIPCVAIGLPKPVISWKLNGATITPNAKYSIEDGALIIRNPTVADTNSYTCEAKNVIGTVSTKCQTYIRQVPKVSGIAEKKVKIGTTGSIECMVVKGEPKPKITWQFMDNSGSKYVPIAGSDNVLHISSVENKHAGRYKCVAQNNVGSDEHITTLIVQDLPKITSDPSTVYQSTEGDASLRIPCVAIGLPKPVISWKLNGATITTNAKYSIEDGALIIRNPTVADTNSYTCEAKNVVGTVSTKYQTYIRQAPKVSGIADKKVKIGTTGSIECMVVKGEPKPKITWLFMDELGSKFVPISGSDIVLRISNVEMKNAGRYKCVAQNNVGSDEHITTLIVQDPPKITSNPSTVYQCTEGDALLRIPCIAIGLPKPVINWKLNGATITPNAKYSIEDGALIIRNPTVTDTNSYTCEAKNVVGTVSTKYQTYIRQAPKVSGIADKKVKIGTTGSIECMVVKGEPKPKITWQFMDELGSKFVPIPGSDIVLRISNVEMKNAGRYKCVAQNNVGRDEHITTLIVQDPPKITSNPSTVYQSTEGDALLRIPCIAIGLPKPVISWKLNGATISLNEKYSVKDGALIIRNPKVTDTNSYTCEAKNEVGTVSTKYQIYIRQAPKVSGVADKRVKIGTTASIECIVDKGEPKPKITWQFMEEFGSKFVPISGSDNVLRISSVKNKHAGRYKCVAQNNVGSDEHVTKLIVEFAPEIISNSSILYKGLEGDKALRIPCDVVGIPKPDITWKLKGGEITSNAKYSIDNGSLIIMNPNEKDSALYQCEAKNYIGSDNATFQAEVEKSLSSFGEVHNVYLLKGETRKLECDTYTSSSQSVRWFKEGIEEKTGTPYRQIVDAKVSDDGNYTCRVSDKHGHANTHTYVVDVGQAPELYDQTPVDAWYGDVNDIVSNCESVAKPPAVVEWKFNDKVLSDRNIAELGISYKWGHYSCNVSNVHGSVQRNFEVKSSVCLINRNLKAEMPLLLTNEKTWPSWEFTKHYAIVKEGEQITLSCPKHNDVPNAFKKFPKQSEIKAICDKQDTFSVDGNLYKLSDLQCSQPFSIEPSVVRTKNKCLTETSELMKVGYNVAGFLEAYEVCFDHAKNMPLYTRVVMTQTDDKVNAAHKWYKYTGIDDGKLERGITCKNPSSSCCYSKSQLVNVRDFSYDPAKYSTYIDPLNAVPSWRPCSTKQTTWEDVDGLVRSQLASYSELTVWSGTHTLQEIHGAVIPRYLWKVVKFDDEQSLAIVHVNDPSPTDKDIKCENICTNVDEPWFKVSGNYTYCCKVSEFLDIFDLRGIDTGE